MNHEQLIQQTTRNSFLKQSNHLKVIFLTPWSNVTITPYWFYPCIFNINPDEKQDNLITLYSKLITTIFPGVENNLGFHTGELQHWLIES